MMTLKMNKEQIIDMILNDYKIPSEISKETGISNEEVRTIIKKWLPTHEVNTKLNWGILFPQEFFERNLPKFKSKSALAREMGCKPITISRYSKSPLSRQDIKTALRRHRIIGETFKSKTYGEYRVEKETRSGYFRVRFKNTDRTGIFTKKVVITGKAKDIFTIEIGDTFKSNTSGTYKVIDKIKDKYKIEFIKTGGIKLVKKTHIKSGEIRDPYYPYVVGVGSKGNVDSQDPLGKKYYSRWHNMIKRCHDTSHKQYSDYGERGIHVSKRWQCFEYYLEDIQKLPNYDKDEYNSIDRIDNNKGYSFENCRFATPSIQSNNQYRVGLDEKADRALLKSLFELYIGTDEKADRTLLKTLMELYGA
jgi:hypothetical protein